MPTSSLKTDLIKLPEETDDAFKARSNELSSMVQIGGGLYESASGRRYRYGLEKQGDQRASYIPAETDTEYQTRQSQKLGGTSSAGSQGTQTITPTGTSTTGTQSGDAEKNALISKLLAGNVESEKFSPEESTAYQTYKTNLEQTAEAEKTARYEQAGLDEQKELQLQEVRNKEVIDALKNSLAQRGILGVSSQSEEQIAKAMRDSEELMKNIREKYRVQKLNIDSETKASILKGLESQRKALLDEFQANLTASNQAKQLAFNIYQQMSLEEREAEKSKLDREQMALTEAYNQGRLDVDQYQAETARIKTEQDKVTSAASAARDYAEAGKAQAETAKIKAETAGIGNIASMTPQQKADAIMNPMSGITLADIPQKERAAVQEELIKRKEEAIKSGDIYGIMATSAGGKPISDSSIVAFEKAFTVLDQIGVLQNNIQSMSTGPLVGLFRGNNPWDTNAQKIKSQLNAIVPNLARGIYGEVGVLTDNDIKNYAKTLPTLQSPEAVRNAVLAITVNQIKKSIENKVKTNASAGKDVSGFLTQYKEMDDYVSGLLGSGGGSSQSIDTLGQQKGFDVAGARAAGYTEEEIRAHLNSL